MYEPASGVGDPAFASASVKFMLPMSVTAPGARTWPHTYTTWLRYVSTSIDTCGLRRYFSIRRVVMSSWIARSDTPAALTSPM